MKRVRHTTESVCTALGTLIFVDPVRRYICCREYEPRQLLHALRVHANIALEKLSEYRSADDAGIVDEQLIRALEEIRDTALDVLRARILLANRTVFQPARFVSTVVHSLLRTEVVKLEIARQVWPRVPCRTSPRHARGALTSADGRPRARHGRRHFPQACACAASAAAALHGRRPPLPLPSTVAALRSRCPLRS